MLWYAQAYLARQNYTSEIIVINDGSSDDTAGYVRRTFPDIQLISYDKNQGKGYAVRTGMQAATGEYRVFSDADGSTPIEELEGLWKSFEAGADIVIGSRSLPQSDVQVRQHPIRESMGRAFNVFVKLLLHERFIDTQCGFKGFTAHSANIIFPRQRLAGFCFDAEILHIAQRHHLRIVEVPVCWTNSPHSRVHMLIDSLSMFCDLIRIRLYDLRGFYQ